MGLASELGNKLISERAQSVNVGDFLYEENITPLGRYWSSQLGEGLANQSGAYSVFSGGASGAEWIISGDIVELADTVRVYTRLIRSQSRSIVAVYHTDLEMNENWAHMLASSDGRHSSNVPRDAWEPDSWDNPVPYEAGNDETTAFMERTLHYDDEDFFLIVPEYGGRMIMETSGNTDTYMELYDAGSREMLAENDDGGSGTNARIRHSMEAGRRYIVKVRGYGSDDTGRYGFRAFYRGPGAVQVDEYEPDDEPSMASLLSIGVPQTHTFHDEDDVDWVKFQVAQRGRYIIRARGVRDNSLDTYIELYDEDMELIDEDDDGGENLDSKLSKILIPGLYFLKIGCFSDDPDQPYTVSVERE